MRLISILKQSRRVDRDHEINTQALRRVAFDRFRYSSNFVRDRVRYASNRVRLISILKQLRRVNRDHEINTQALGVRKSSTGASLREEKLERVVRSRIKGDGVEVQSEF